MVGFQNAYRTRGNQRNNAAEGKIQVKKVSWKMRHLYGGKHAALFLPLVYNFIGWLYED